MKSACEYLNSQFMIIGSTLFFSDSKLIKTVSCMTVEKRHSFSLSFKTTVQEFFKQRVFSGSGCKTAGTIPNRVTCPLPYSRPRWAWSEKRDQLQQSEHLWVGRTPPLRRNNPENYSLHRIPSHLKGSSYPEIHYDLSWCRNQRGNISLACVLKQTQ